MFNASQSFNSSYATSPAQRRNTVHRAYLTLRIIFGIIACFSVFGNCLVCLVILKRGNNLRNSYNLMILALAIRYILIRVVCDNSFSCIIDANALVLKCGYTLWIWGWMETNSSYNISPSIAIEQQYTAK